jgi:cell division protease FtsH
MVTQYGMSDLGPIQYGRGQHQVFLGRDISEERNYSEEVASKIDGQVRKIIETCYEDGKRLLTENWQKVERMVASLLEYETVEAQEVQAILDGKPFDRVRGEEVVAAPESGGDKPAAEEAKRSEKPTRFPPNISPEPA